FEHTRWEVFGEAVVEAAPEAACHARKRRVDQFRFFDFAVVVVLNQFGRFGRQPGRFVDEDFAQRRGKLGGVAAEPDPAREPRHPRRRRGHHRGGPHRAPTTSGNGGGGPRPPPAETSTEAPNRIATRAGNESVLVFCAASHEKVPLSGSTIVILPSHRIS